MSGDDGWTTGGLSVGSSRKRGGRDHLRVVCSDPKAAASAASRAESTILAGGPAWPKARVGVVLGSCTKGVPPGARVLSRFTDQGRFAEGNLKKSTGSGEPTRATGFHGDQIPIIL